MNFEKAPMGNKRPFDPEEIKQLHDQKKGDFNVETGVIYNTDSADFDKVLAYQEAVEVRERIGQFSETEQHVTALLEQINGLQLLPEYQNNTEQQALLKKKINIVKSLMKDCLEYAVEYVGTIRKMSQVKANKTETDPEAWKTEMMHSDQERRTKHNALIDSLKILNRNLQNNFGEISEERLVRFTTEEKRSGRDVVQVDRQVFPAKGIAPEKVDLNERDQVKDWAISINESLEQLKKELM